MDRRDKQGWLGRAVIWGLGLSLLAGAVVLGVFEAQQATLIAEGDPAPPFSWPRHQGGEVALAEHQGKVVMVNFWATWCSPCIREMPMLVKVAEEFGPRGLVFVAANSDDPPEAVAAVSRFIQRIPALETFVAYPDAQSLRDYQVSAFPTMYLIDRHGRVAVARSGELSETTLRRWVERALVEGN